MESMVVAAVQMRSVVGDAAGNAARACRWIERAAHAGAALACFPECNVTGYSTVQAPEIALDADAEELREIERCAHSRGMAVGYGFVERVGAGSSSAKPYATYVVASPQGRLVYRKTHLGTREQAAFQAGDELPVADIAGVCVGVQLCWEAHLPDVAVTLRAKGAELLLAPHAVPVGGERRLELWNRYLAARAYDNGTFLVAVNGLQQADGGEMRGGGIAVYDAKGVRIASCDSDEESMVVATVGGALPRECADAGMGAISYFDRRRPELYR